MPKKTKKSEKFLKPVAIPGYKITGKQKAVEVNHSYTKFSLTDLYDIITELVTWTITIESKDIKSISIRERNGLFQKLEGNSLFQNLIKMPAFKEYLLSIKAVEEIKETPVCPICNKKHLPMRDTRYNYYVFSNFNTSSTTFCPYSHVKCTSVEEILKIYDQIGKTVPPFATEGK